jgi:hypothetical protein
MIDDEVIRLRRLRNSALRARALARVLDSHPARGASLLSRSAVSCWQIVRAITGTLRAHPYRNFQRGPSAMLAVCHRTGANFRGAIARYRHRSLQIVCADLRRVARELNDARALTRSAELSDVLGRLQDQMRWLLKEVDAGARKEAGSFVGAAARPEPSRVKVADTDGNGELTATGTWRYLGI